MRYEETSFKVMTMVLRYYFGTYITYNAMLIYEMLCGTGIVEDNDEAPAVLEKLGYLNILMMAMRMK